MILAANFDFSRNLKEVYLLNVINRAVTKDVNFPSILAPFEYL